MDGLGCRLRGCRRNSSSHRDVGENVSSPDVMSGNGQASLVLGESKDADQWQARWYVGLAQEQRCNNSSDVSCTVAVD